MINYSVLTYERGKSATGIYPYANKLDCMYNLFRREALRSIFPKPSVSLFENRNEYSALFLAVCDPNLLGFAILNQLTTDPSTWYHVAAYVSGSHRRCGIWSDLLDQNERYARKHGARKIETNLVNPNIRVAITEMGYAPMFGMAKGWYEKFLT